MRRERGDSNWGPTQSLGGSQAAETRRGFPQCTPAWSVPPPLLQGWGPRPTASHHCILRLLAVTG